MKGFILAASSVAFVLGAAFLAGRDWFDAENSPTDAQSFAPAPIASVRNPTPERTGGPGNAAVSSGSDPVPTAATQTASTPQVEDFFGYSLLKNRRCDAEIVELEDRDGNSRQALKCTPRNPRQRAYEHIDDASLAAMAYSDAGAAYELAVRNVSDLELMHRYLIRAVALDERYVIHMPWITSHLFPRNAGVEAAGGRYLYAYLQTLVDPGADASIDRNHFFDQGGTELAAENIRVIADAVFNQMAQVRADVTADPSWLGGNR